MSRVEGGIGRVDERLQKMAQDMQAMARGVQESLMRVKNLQAPNYPYPSHMEVEAAPATGKWSRFRSVFVVDLSLHFLCPSDMSRVPCGVSGNGYPLRKTRGWVKKISPALQVWRVFCGAFLT